MRRTIGILCWVGVAAAQTGANCDVPCNSYSQELQSANNLFSQNVYTVGGAFARPAVTVQAVCGFGNDIQTCHVCSTNGQGLSNDAARLRLLNAWWETCATFQAQGVDNAYACWLSVPGGSGSCAYLVSNGDRPRSSALTTSTSQTSVLSTSTSPTSILSSSTSQISTTSVASATANLGRSQRGAWHSGFAGTIAGLLVDLLL